MTSIRFAQAKPPAAHVLERVQVVRAGRDEAFAFYADAFNLESITPPWLRFRVITPTPIAMDEGTLIDYRLALHGAPVRWRTRIAVWEPPHRFVDIQLRGPFSLWEHTHTFEPDEGGTLIRDIVRYRVPSGPLGRIAERLVVRRDLRRIFDYRHEAVAQIMGSAATRSGSNT